MAAAALLMAGIVSGETVFADNNMTDAQSIPAEVSVDQEEDSNTGNVKSDTETAVSGTGDAPGTLLTAELSGQFLTVTLYDPGDLSSVSAAIWSEADGQDDLVWYPMTENADGNFTVKANLGIHRSTGRFIVHVFSGNSFLTGGSLELEAAVPPSLHVETDKDDPNTAVVSVYNAFGFTNVRAAVWGSKNYQNDIQWYEMQKSGDGLYSTEIDLSDHEEEGYYYFHVYGEYAGNVMMIDSLVTDPAVADIDEETALINENALTALAQRSGDEELSILFIGNSITTYGVADEWWGTWGMGATDADKDYVHIVADTFSEHINTHYGMLNFAAWELEEYDRESLLRLLDDYLNERCDLIVIQLGENIKDPHDVQEDFEALFQYCSAKVPGAKILAVGNFWSTPQVDAAKNAACADMGIPLVDLGDIRTDPKYQCGIGTVVKGEDGNLHQVSILGVAVHPGNFGMDKIGNRVMEAALES